MTKQDFIDFCKSKCSFEVNNDNDLVFDVTINGYRKILLINKDQDWEEVKDRVFSNSNPLNPDPPS